MKKMLSALLALALILACLPACGQAAAPVTTPEPSPSPEATPTPTRAPDAYTRAYESFNPDDTVLTVNGDAVSWAVYYYWIHNVVYQIRESAAQAGTELDWAADLDEEHTFQSYAESYARDSLTQYVVVGQQAEALGLVLSEDEQAEIDAIRAEDVAEFGGGDEDAFDAYLAERFVPRGMYEEMNRLSVYYRKLFEHYFGETGESLPTADALAYAADAGYMHAKHILVDTADSAAELLDQLTGLSGGELEAKFDELMSANSTDPGLATAPDGYYFRPGEFVQPFEDAVNALADGELYPEPVESVHGWHLILRLPLDVDAPMDRSGYTLRTVAASALFGNMAGEWFDAAEVVYTDKFARLDFNELFNGGTHGD